MQLLTGTHPNRAELSLEHGMSLNLATRSSRTLIARAMTTTVSQARTRPIVISGPSGTGKSTLLKRLFDEHQDIFGFSISNTTRQPRTGERNGIDYNFITREEFTQGIDRGAFIEYAEFSGNMYGTTVAAVEAVSKGGKKCILDIDMQGVILVKKTDLNARFLFVKPPSEEALEVRLRGRGTDSEEAIQKRLAQAKKELQYAEKDGAHDKILVNDNLDRCYKELEQFCMQE